MEQPRIVGDTLRGLVKDQPSRDVDVPLADIATLRVPKTDATKSILLGLGIVAGAFAVLVVVAESQCESFLCLGAED